MNDYVWGQGGIDHIVTQLLNQFETGNSENISPEDIARIPMTQVFIIYTILIKLIHFLTLLIKNLN